MIASRRFDCTLHLNWMNYQGRTNTLNTFYLWIWVLIYAPSHRHDITYHGLCYTSHGTLAGTRNSSRIVSQFLVTGRRYSEFTYRSEWEPLSGLDPIPISLTKCDILTNGPPKKVDSDVLLLTKLTMSSTCTEWTACERPACVTYRECLLRSEDVRPTSPRSAITTRQRNVRTYLQWLPVLSACHNKICFVVVSLEEMCEIAPSHHNVIFAKNALLISDLLRHTENLVQMMSWASHTM